MTIFAGWAYNEIATCYDTRCKNSGYWEQPHRFADIPGDNGTNPPWWLDAPLYCWLHSDLGESNGGKFFFWETARVLIGQRGTTYEGLLHPSPSCTEIDKRRP